MGKVQRCPEVEPWDAILYLTCPYSWPFLCRSHTNPRKTNQIAKGGGVHSVFFSSSQDAPHFFFSSSLWDSLFWALATTLNMIFSVTYIVSHSFMPNFHHPEVFRHRNLGGALRIIDVFYFKSILTSTRSMTSGLSSCQSWEHMIKEIQLLQ